MRHRFSDLCGSTKLSDEQHDFRVDGGGGEGGEVIDNNMRDLVFSTNFARNIFHSEKNSVKFHDECT